LLGHARCGFAKSCRDAAKEAAFCKWFRFGFLFRQTSGSAVFGAFNFRSFSGFAFCDFARRIFFGDTGAAIRFFGFAFEAVSLRLFFG